jgi:hypothetical protein
MTSPRLDQVWRISALFSSSVCCTSPRRDPMLISPLIGWKWSQQTHKEEGLASLLPHVWTCPHAVSIIPGDSNPVPQFFSSQPRDSWSLALVWLPRKTRSWKKGTVLFRNWELKNIYSIARPCNLGAQVQQKTASKLKPTHLPRNNQIMVPELRHHEFRTQTDALTN